MMRYFVLAAALQTCTAPALAQYVDGPTHLHSTLLLPQGVGQSSKSFARAVGEISTSSHYVRIQTGSIADYLGSVSCVSGWDLNLAIRREYGLPATAEGITQAKNIALANTDRVFRFTNPAALALVTPTFSEDDLVQTRARLARLSNNELRAGFSLSPWGDLHAHYRDRKQRDAAACILIERGMSPGIADRTGSIYIDE